MAAMAAASTVEVPPPPTRLLLPILDLVTSSLQLGSETIEVACARHGLVPRILHACSLRPRSAAWHGAVARLLEAMLGGVCVRLCVCMCLRA